MYGLGEASSGMAIRGNEQRDHRAAYLTQVRDLLGRLSDLEPSFERFFAELERMARDGRQLFILGNGGSAAAAAHLANDLAMRVFDGCSLRVRALGNTVELTGYANDFSYEEAFTRLLESQLLPGDSVLALSVSGNSENLVRACEWARAHGAGSVLSITGFDGGRLARLADLNLGIYGDTRAYGPYEDAQLVLCHMLASSYSYRHPRPTTKPSASASIAPSSTATRPETGL